MANPASSGSVLAAEEVSCCGLGRLGVSGRVVEEYGRYEIREKLLVQGSHVRCGEQGFPRFMNHFLSP